MNLYITFLQLIINRSLFISNGFSFGIDKKEDDVFLFFTNLTPTRRIQEELKKYKPERIFCSISYTSDLNLISSILDERWIIGGPIVLSSYLREVLKNTSATVVVGPMETYLGKDLSGNFIPYFKDFIENTLVKGMFLYYNASVGYGCYWGKCKFCSYREILKWTNEKVIERPNVTNFLSSLPELTKCEAFVVAHTCIDALTPNLLHKVLSAEKSKVLIKSFIRADKPIIDALSNYHDLSNHVLSIGMEGFSQKVLDELDKGMKIELILQAIEEIVARGAYCNLDVMVNYPFLTEDDVSESLETLSKINKIQMKYSKVRIIYNGPVLWPKEEDISKYGFPFQRACLKIAGEERRGDRLYNIFPKDSKMFELNEKIITYIERSGIPITYNYRKK